MYNKLPLFLFVIVLFSCSNNKSNEQLQSILGKIKNSPQIFEFSSDSIITIKGEKGTVLNIDPNNLIAPSNKKIENIRVELLELTTASELLKNNVQTVSNNKWLISGGSFKIDIYSNNELLKLKKGKTISVSFPKIRNEKMQLFYGTRNENNVMNWELGNQAFTPKKRFGLISEIYAIPDDVKNDRYRVNGYFKEGFRTDTLGYIDLEEFKKIAFERGIDTTIIKSDTIIGIKQYYLVEEQLKPLSYRDSLDSDYFEKIALEKTFYKAIQISKLGWINVDCFYPEITERYSLEILKDPTIDGMVLYILDMTNNTVLNVFETENQKYFIDLPPNKSFTVVAFGVKNQQPYVLKKTIRLRKDEILKTKFEKIDKNKLSGFFDTI
jgi:hypothetical protein